MTTTKESWDQVGESWCELGRHLKDQYQKLTEDQAREAREDRAKLNEAANKLSEHVGEALSAMRGLVKDPETKESMDRVVQATGVAISATFDAVAAEIRERLPGVESAEPAKVAAPASPSEAAEASSN